MRVVWDISELPLDHQMRDQYFKFLDVELTKKLLDKGYLPKQYLIEYVHLKSNPAFIESEKFAFTPQEFEERKVALKQLSELFNSRGLVSKGSLKLDKFTYPVVPNMVAVYQHLYKHLNKQAGKVRGSRSPSGAKSPSARSRSRSRSVSHETDSLTESHSRSSSPVPFATPVVPEELRKRSVTKRTPATKKKSASPTKKKSATPKKKTAASTKKKTPTTRKPSTKKKSAAVEVNVVPMPVPTAFATPTPFAPPTPFASTAVPTPFAVPTRV